MNRLRQLREDKGLRQIDVAQATGIDQKTLSNYETGKTNPDSYSLIRLADYYHTSIDYIVGRTNLQIENKKDIVKKLNDIQRDLDYIKKIL
jgi:transcriptional regulator with XRE-family HTH domain